MTGVQTCALPISTIGQATGSQALTLSFDEQVQGWTSFYSYVPSVTASLDNDFYTFDLSGDLYRHYSTTSNRANFYGNNNISSVTTVFNAKPSLIKTFQTINYEGDSNWGMNLFQTNTDTANSINVFNIPTTLVEMENALLKNEFKAKENKYFANLINTTSVNQGEVIFGKEISGVKGFYATVRLVATNLVGGGQTGTNELFAVSTSYKESSY